MSLSAVIKPDSWTQRLELGELFEHPAHPLEVDLGCGKGRFVVARARKHPEINFIGIDRQLVRIRRTDKKANRENLANLRLLRIEITYAVEHLIPPESVSAMYLLFPDPWPKRRHFRRRLINAHFLHALSRCLVPGGTIHIATDHGTYVQAIGEEFAGQPAFTETEPFCPEEDEVTEFERIFISEGRQIYRCSFKTPVSAGCIVDPCAPRAHTPMIKP